MALTADVRTLAGLLLVLGPVIGAIPVANPSLIRIWSASREAHLAAVGAHRVAWAWLNGGFTVATIATALGLALLPGVSGGSPTTVAALTGVALTYAIGGGLWCAVLGIRAGTTPALADLVAAGRPTEPGETLLGAASGGLFAAFVLITAGALVALGMALALGGGVALPLAIVAVAVGVLAIALQLATGDVIPATLYLPTLLIGIALLAGWT